jgi:hypothetical protein
VLHADLAQHVYRWRFASPVGRIRGSDGEEQARAIDTHPLGLGVTLRFLGRQPVILQPLVVSLYPGRIRMRSPPLWRHDGERIQRRAQRLTHQLDPIEGAYRLRARTD